MAKTDAPRIAILGGGPVGLEAALYARSLNLPATLYERGRVGEHPYRRGNVRFFRPFGMNVTPLGRATIQAEKADHPFPGENEYRTGRQHVTAYLEPLVRTSLLRGMVKTDTQVLQVGRRGFLKEDGPGDSKRAQQPFRLLLREAKKTERTEEVEVVLDCTGTYGQHRWMGDGGIPAAGELTAEQQIAYGLEDILGERRSAYAGKNVLLAGSGYSAATSACNLVSLAESDPGTWVVWLVRGAVTQPLKRIASDPLRERDRLAMRANNLATRAEGNIEFHNQTVIESIETAGPGFRVHTRSGGKPRIWEVERLIANVGYSPDTGLYRELQVHECYASLGPMNLAAALLKHAGGDCLSIPSQGAETLRNPEPGFFILGAKSYGRNSQFLLRTGFEQVRDVFKLITGKADLDLYKKR